MREPFKTTGKINLKLKLSFGLLARIVETSFGAYSPEVYKPEMRQQAFGLNVSRELNNEYLKEITAGIVYYNVDNVNLGTIATIISNTSAEFNQSVVLGGIRGGTKAVAEVAATLKLTDTLKLQTSAGIEQVNYNEFLGNAEKSTTGGVAGLNLTYQPDSHNKLDVRADFSSNSQTLSVGYAHKLQDGMEVFVEASQTRNTGGFADTNKIFAGVRGTWGGSKNSKDSSGKFAPLFKAYNEGTTKLNFGDLKVSDKVATTEIQVHEAVTQVVNEVVIDKTKLVA